MVYSLWFLHTANQCFVSLRLGFFRFVSIRFVWSLHSRAYDRSAYTHEYTRSSGEQNKKHRNNLHSKNKTVYDKAQQHNPQLYYSKWLEQCRVHSNIFGLIVDKLSNAFHVHEKYFYRVSCLSFVVRFFPFPVGCYFPFLFFWLQTLCRICALIWLDLFVHSLEPSYATRVGIFWASLNFFLSQYTRNVQEVNTLCRRSACVVVNMLYGNT